MFSPKRMTNMALLAAAAWGCSAGLAQAYLDPGTGSFFLQMFIAAIAGGFFTIKMYWAKVKAFFSHKTAGESDATS